MCVFSLASNWVKFGLPMLLKIDNKCKILYSTAKTFVWAAAEFVYKSAPPLPPPSHD
jgi:hypothetical protein